MSPDSESQTGDKAADGKPRHAAVGRQTQIVTIAFRHDAQVGEITEHDHSAVVQRVGNDGDPQASGPHQQVAQPQAQHDARHKTVELEMNGAEDDSNTSWIPFEYESVEDENGNDVTDEANAAK